MKSTNRVSGLTVIELMMALAVLGVLVSLAAPAMTNLIRANELKSGRSSLMSSLAFTRNEALARREQVVMCASTNGSSCSSSANWSTGWIVYLDENADGFLTTADCNPVVGCILRVQDDLPGQVSLTGGASWLAYNRTGDRNIAGASFLRLCAGNAAASADTDRSFTFNISDSGLNRMNEGTTACP